MSRVALGFRAHSGWAAVVALEGGPAAPRVLLRRRLELLEGGVAGGAQPYHTASQMRLEEAEQFLAECRAASHAAACGAVRRAVEQIARKGYEVAGGCVLLAAGRNVTDLKTILGSHPLLHTAEGQFYREALQAACAACQLEVRCVKEKDVAESVARGIGVSVDELGRRVAELGKSIGPPWTRDQKLAAMAAWMILTGL